MSANPQPRMTIVEAMQAAELPATGDRPGELGSPTAPDRRAEKGRRLEAAATELKLGIEDRKVDGSSRGRQRTMAPRR